LQFNNYSVEESVRIGINNREDAFDDIQQVNKSLDTSLNETNSIANIVHIERFTRKYGRATQLDNDGCICQDNGGFLSGDGCAAGTIDYRSGIHTIKMRVEFGRPFIGILSPKIGIIGDKTRLKEPRFYQFPIYYRTRSAHGWCTSDSVKTHANHWYPKYLSYRIVDGKESSTQTEWGRNVTEDNDIFQLTINCDEQQLNIVNERTQDHDTMHVELSDAPHPWRLFVVFCDLKSRVHLLQSSKQKAAIDYSLVPAKKQRLCPVQVENKIL
jgi:hypothetical protein